jgi:CRP-like cAMP-binding protein
MEDTVLLKALKGIAPLSEALSQYIYDHVSHHFFAKGSQMPYIKPIYNMVYFIECGLVCGVQFKPDKKRTLWFGHEQTFIVPGLLAPNINFTDSFEFLMPTVLVGMEIEAILSATEIYPELKLLGMTILDQYISDLMNRDLLLRLPSELRYAAAFAQYPQYFVDSNNDHLASYLNISKRHFARLKREFNQQKPK